ncbi:AAA family ATPase [Solwaraspora sp. WMMD406]|uniref:AAA family ATPase n=1 Tax=Solwaraspora sp. WMMD406 TaxID=3016095 RepID=UPI002415D890|nr:LuxR family transcriptional regulator [Solwaraspora sp. WMMD406]MDG4763511.1 AAA family ATPase [Solwaraspora sp. WMMD406]
MRQILIERWAESLVLNRTVENLCQGIGDLVVIEGGCGIGRTALLLELQRMAEARQLVVCVAHCSSSEAEFPYGVIHQLLEPHLSRLAAGRTEDSPTAAELLQVMDPVAPPSSDVSDIHVLNGMLWAIRGLAAQAPVVLAVDDLNFGDAHSLHVLAYVARRLKGQPVAIVVTRRLGEPVTSPPMLAALHAAGEWTVLRPALLTAAGTGELADGFLGPTPAPVVDELHQLTAGNPMLLSAMLMAAGPYNEPTGPVLPMSVVERFVGSTMRTRLAHLPAGVPGVAETIAILEGEADAALIAEAAGMTEAEAATGLAVLGGMGLLTDQPLSTYVHPVVGKALRRLPEVIVPDTVHRLMSEALHRRQAAPADIARHLLRAGPVGAEWVPDVLRAAANKALAERRMADASALLRRAFDEPLAAELRDEVQAALDCIELITDPQAILVRLRTRLAAARTPQAHVSTVLGYAQALIRTNRVDEVGEALQGCRVSLAAVPPSRQRDNLIRQINDAEAMSALLGCSAAADIADLLAKLTDLGADDVLHERSLWALQAAVEGRTSAAEVVGGIRRAVATQVPRAREPQLMPYVVFTLLWADELELVYQWCDAVLTGQSGAGRLSTIVVALALRASAQLEAGRLHSAEHDARQALDLLGEQEIIDPVVSLVLTPLVHTLIELDRTDEAFALLNRCGGAGTLPKLWPQTMLLAARGRLRGACGDTKGALDDLSESGRRMERWGTTNPAISRWRSEAAFMRNQLGDVTGALRLVEEELHAARRWGSTRAVGVALRAKGLIHGSEEGLAALTEAVRVLRSGPACLETAYAEASLGIVQRRENNRRAARETLRRALALAQQLGAVRLAGRVHAELLTAGGLPRRCEHFGTKALTASEYRVALLAAVGRTNGAIARELFVTQRTVETHLTRAYRKLGIQGRSELGRVLQV